MRQLRFVRPTDDGTHLVVETADGNEQFCVRVDDALRDAARADLPRLGGIGPAPGVAPVRAAEPEMQISPREIQVRVRAGETPQELADAYGVSLERIMRFAGAVLEERLRISDEARRARARRSTTEGQNVVFGEAVDDRFVAHGIVATDVTWDSRRRDDGEWIITAAWVGGDSTHTAEWVFHRSSRSVTPLDDTAADLLSDRPIRPVLPPQPEPARLVAAPPLAPGVVAFPPMPDALTGPLPRYQDVYDQDSDAEGPRDLPPFVPAAVADPAVEPAAAATSAASAAEPVLDLEGFDAPPLPLGITDPTTRPAAAGLRVASMANLGVARREETEDDKAARARIPSWDDILLGVRRKQD